MMKFKGFFEGIKVDAFPGGRDRHNVSVTFRTCGLSFDQVTSLKHIIATNQTIPTIYNISIEPEHHPLTITSPRDALLEILEGYGFDIPEVTRHVVCDGESYVVVLPAHVTEETIIRIKRDILRVLPEDIGVFVTRKCGTPIKIHNPITDEWTDGESGPICKPIDIKKEK